MAHLNTIQLLRGLDADVAAQTLADGEPVWATDALTLYISQGSVNNPLRGQNVSTTARIFGRKTAGAGPVEEMTLSDVLDLFGAAAQGDVLFRGAAGWQYLPAGTAGYAFTTGGTGADPNWASTGNVVGPGSSTDHGIARYDGTTGKLLEDSGVTIDDRGNEIGRAS